MGEREGYSNKYLSYTNLLFVMANTYRYFNTKFLLETRRGILGIIQLFCLFRPISL